MEKKSITGKDILRMDGLLPPTRRVPICDAVTGTPEKKKEKKWSIGRILKRISSIRDCDSSSNEEEMVYCKREPCRRPVPLRKASDVVLRPVRRNLDQYSSKGSVASTIDNNPHQCGNTSTFQRDSIHSRSSDGSLDGLGRKIRKSKLKARAEAKRDRIRGESSSDEDLHRSNNSLTRAYNEDSLQIGQKNSSFNKKTRSARTERYIKRLSKDEGHGTLENLSEIANKRNSLDYMNDSQRTVDHKDDVFRPPIHPRRFITQPNSYTFPAQRTSSENLRDAVGLPETQTRSSVDLTKYPFNTYITDLNQNNEYAKPARIVKKDVQNYVTYRRTDYPANQSNEVCRSRIDNNYINIDNYPPGYQIGNRSACPPEPPPRDPRCRLTAYNCYSFPFNGRHTNVTKSKDVVDAGTNFMNGISPHPSKTSVPHSSHRERNWCGSSKTNPRRPTSLNEGSLQSCNLEDCTNNRHRSTGNHVDEYAFRKMDAMKCQMRNSWNDRLSSNFKNYAVPSCKPRCPTGFSVQIPESHQSLPESSSYICNGPTDALRVSSPFDRTIHEYSRNSPTVSAYDNAENKEQEDSQNVNTEDESLQRRRRSSKNLEEALSELEAIYNSLRLGDEDLLDRAERRSMEEFSMRQGKPEDTRIPTPPDSPDRTKDDMAYRRMNPKERPASLSEAVGQSGLPNISYLMASPILSRKDRDDDYLGIANCPNRPDEPDITRDDVVYRSIHHANNTLKVADPQPPFGIPLGPVTTAPESDYLHTTPTKPDHPRSPYIPQCEPDIVTDDLAYRTLRKDANTSKNVIESKNSIIRDEETAFGIKKKRGTRSLTTNLYGLINHDRIHLRREPSFHEITDDIAEAKINYLSPPEQPECFRRVVSDGELSDYDTRWRTDDRLRKRTDMNGNQSNCSMNRKKLRVYISPSSKEHCSDTESGMATEAVSSSASDAALSSKLLTDDFWQDYLPSESNGSANANKDTETDFNAYSRLCQDLVNLIEDPDDAEVKPIKAEEATESILKETIKINGPEVTSKDDEPSILRIQSLGRHYPGSDDAICVKESTDVENIEKPADSIIVSEKTDSENAEENTLDFYMRLADENVKLIAEAFSSVADHLRDSQTRQKNSLSSRRYSTENDSTTHDTSTRSSIACSQDDDASTEKSDSSNAAEKPDVVPTQDDLSLFKENEGQIPTNCVNVGEHDLSKIVHDLQTAAASLCEHEKEIEELEQRLKKNSKNNDIPTIHIESIENAESEESESHEDCCLPESERRDERERDQEETEVSADVKTEVNESDEEDEGLQALDRS